MADYSIYLATEAEKYDCIAQARKAGATVTGVSGCGPGYYIQIDATAAQADYINRNLYTSEIHNMSATQVMQAWHAGKLTVNQVVEWQEKHGVYFDNAGNVMEEN